jgi:hypothetical protein
MIINFKERFKMRNTSYNSSERVYQREHEYNPPVERSYEEQNDNSTTAKMQRSTLNKLIGATCTVAVISAVVTVASACTLNPLFALIAGVICVASIVLTIILLVKRSKINSETSNVDERYFADRYPNFDVRTSEGDFLKQRQSEVEGQTLPKFTPERPRPDFAPVDVIPEDQMEVPRQPQSPDFQPRKLNFDDVDGIPTEPTSPTEPRTLPDVPKSPLSKLNIEDVRNKKLKPIQSTAASAVVDPILEIQGDRDNLKIANDGLKHRSSTVHLEGAQLLHAASRAKLENKLNLKGKTDEELIAAANAQVGKSVPK